MTTVTATAQTRRRWRSLAAGALAVLLGVSALNTVGIAPAAAASDPRYGQQQYIFNSAAGSRWNVPSGVYSVYVGLRGGDGGNAARSGAGGAGDSIVVRLEVKPGDTLTLYAGHSATGKTNDQREGGLGYARGGDGGKGSVDGKNAGGGGGAAAVLVNGKLAAIAGGGGGAGGNGGYDTGTKKNAAGGIGGSFKNDKRTAPTAGSGTSAGAAASMEFYKKDLKVAGRGSDAANVSGAGGGGGGGAGWQNGAGGNGGKRAGLMMGNGGGGGGAPGSSDIAYSNGEVKRVWAAETMPSNFATYRGPVAEKGTVKVVIPMTSRLNLTTNEFVRAGTVPVLNFAPTVSTSRYTRNTLPAGTVQVFQGRYLLRSYNTEKIVSNQGVFDTSSDPLPTLKSGTLELLTRFVPASNPGDFNYPEENSDQQTVITALPVLAGTVAVAGEAVPGSTLSADLSEMKLSDTEKPGVRYHWLRDGEIIRGATGADYAVTEADQGAAISVRLRSDGYWGSVDAPPVVVKRAIGLTLETDAAGPVLVGDTVLVTAKLDSTWVPANGGEVELRIDGTPVGTDAVLNGVATFALPGMNAGTHTLTAHYGAAENTLPAQSEPVTVEVRLAPQSITLNGLGDDIEVGESVQLTATGGSGSGGVRYESNDPAIASVTASGRLTAHTEGPVTVTVTRAADERFEAASSSVHTLVVPAAPPAALTPLAGATVAFTTSVASRQYSGDPHRPDGITVTMPDSTVLSPGDFSVEYGPNTEAGTGTITVIGQGDYDGTAQATFAIERLPVNIIAEDEVRIFGETDPQLHWHAEPALALADTLAGELSYTGTAVGSYAIGQGSLDLSNPNYAFTFVPATMHIVPGGEVRAVKSQILALPNPIDSLSDADRVAAVARDFGELSQVEREQLPAPVREALRTAQTQAAAVNQGIAGGEIAARSPELESNWSIRVVVTPITTADSSEVYSGVVQQLAEYDRLPVVLYDVSFVDTITGASWAPSEPVTVTLTGVDLDGWEQINVVDEGVGGELETQQFTETGGSLTFAADSFTLIGVTAVAKQQPVEQPSDNDGDGTPNHSHTDVDGDGIPNGEDPDVNGDGVPNGQDGDVDGDGIPNGQDPDIDGDGIPNGQDPDIDGDGIPNATDPDMDGDGIPNERDPDENGDGIADTTSAPVGLNDASDVTAVDAGAPETGAPATSGLAKTGAAASVVSLAVAAGAAALLGALLLLGRRYVRPRSR